ncbi:MAG: zeta toxin family protein [Candidatus Thorarchaeota archaeon]
MSSTTSRTTRSQLNQLIDYMDIYSNPDSGERKTNWRDLTRSDNPKLIIMVGAPASGKSVVRSACAGECGIEDALILNPDNLMENKYGNDNEQRGEVNEDFKVLYHNIFDNKLGINIIYDRTGAYKEHSEFIINLVRAGAIKRGNMLYEIVLCIVVTPLDVGLERAVSREQKIGRSVPPAVIKKIHESIESVREDYETNNDTIIFKSLKNAQEELSGRPSRTIAISNDGSLLLPTRTKGIVPIRPGDYRIELDPRRKKQPTILTTPEAKTQITREFYDEKDEGLPDDASISKDAIIYIDTGKEDRIKFKNSYTLFDTIMAFDNTTADQPPTLVYLYEDGKVIVDKEFAQIRESRKNPNTLTKNRFDVLDTYTGRTTAAMRGGKKRKTRRKKRKTKRRRTRKSKTKRRSRR